MPLRDYIDDILPPSPNRASQGLPRSPGSPKSLNFISILAGVQSFVDAPAGSMVSGSVLMYPVPIPMGARIRIVTGTVHPLPYRSSFTFPCFFQWGGIGITLGAYAYPLRPLRTIPTHNAGQGLFSVSSECDVMIPGVVGGIYLGVVNTSDAPGFDSLFVGVE